LISHGPGYYVNERDSSLGLFYSYTIKIAYNDAPSDDPYAFRFYSKDEIKRVNNLIKTSSGDVPWSLFLVKDEVDTRYILDFETTRPAKFNFKFPCKQLTYYVINRDGNNITSITTETTNG
jgi:hypothetical protein